MAVQQKKYTALDGSSEIQGDLKAVVLHSMDVSHVKSTFPISLGARISGVDDSTYTSTGEAFSHVILPNSESSSSKKLQADDVSLGGHCFVKTLLHPLLTHTSPRMCIQPTSSARSSRGTRLKICPRKVSTVSCSCALRWINTTRSACCSHTPLVCVSTEVSARRFVLVSADHPIVSAISENADKCAATTAIR